MHLWRFHALHHVHMHLSLFHVQHQPGCTSASACSALLRRLFWVHMAAYNAAQAPGCAHCTACSTFTVARMAMQVTAAAPPAPQPHGVHTGSVALIAHLHCCALNKQLFARHCGALCLIGRFCFLAYRPAALAFLGHQHDNTARLWVSAWRQRHRQQNYLWTADSISVIVAYHLAMLGAQHQPAQHHLNSSAGAPGFLKHHRHHLPSAHLHLHIASCAA